MTRDEIAKTNAPRVPGETCPMIDPLSTLLDAIAGDLDTFREGIDERRRKTVDREDVVELLLDQSRNLASARLRLEEIRTANEQLRESGRYWRGVARGANDQLDALLAALEPYRHRLPVELDALIGRARAAA